eukprot:6357781-Prymnesium_polylepis.1
MVSPGARLRHIVDGQPVTFSGVKGSFLEKSWGYLASCAPSHRPPHPRPSPWSLKLCAPVHLRSWHLLDGADIGMDGSGGPSAPSPRRWSICSETVDGARCIGWRCGLEFKMPMKTAAIGWFVGLTA